MAEIQTLTPARLARGRESATEGALWGPLSPYQPRRRS